MIFLQLPHNRGSHPRGRSRGSINIVLGAGIRVWQDVERIATGEPPHAPWEGLVSLDKLR
jgi:hypothetical protein